MKRMKNVDSIIGIFIIFVVFFCFISFKINNITHKKEVKPTFEENKQNYIKNLKLKYPIDNNKFIFSDKFNIHPDFTGIDVDIDFSINPVDIDIKQYYKDIGADKFRLTDKEIDKLESNLIKKYPMYKDLECVVGKAYVTLKEISISEFDGKEYIGFDIYENDFGSNSFNKYSFSVRDSEVSKVKKMNLKKGDKIFIIGKFSRFAQRYPSDSYRYIGVEDCYIIK